jgi:uncharacterized protein
MKVFISEIPEEGLDLTFKGEDFVWIGLKGLNVSTYPHGKVIIEKSGLTVFVKGDFNSELLLSCSRCLETFPFPLDLEFSHTLRPKPIDTLEREVELLPEDLESGYYEEDTVELGRLIEESLLLSIPMKPLCQDTCLGICPMCGVDRNIHLCRCVTGLTNSPFSVLKGFFKENT